MLKSGVFAALAAVLAGAATPVPAGAQDIFAGFVLARVCLPYAGRAQSLEDAVQAAREMEFRRPSADQAPLDDWASSVELVSKDGAWRVRIEEGTVTRDDIDVYTVTCGISSTRASARELRRVARLTLRDSANWTSAGEDAGRWDRRTQRPEEQALHVDIVEAPGQRPALVATGSYF